ncbi:MAG TPA: DUF2141 domain-containing protein [Caulobacteraceae bacterium]|nr:DUF2141 domain-containing protein [Caulobacteraceae bacterium]
MTPKTIAVALAASLLSLSIWSLSWAQPDSAPAPGASAIGPIEVQVWNIHRAAGHIRVQICTRQTFADAHKACPYHADAPAHQGVTIVSVPDVPAGTYAAEVYQDDDDRNVLRRGPLGVPLEGVGFSNDAPVGVTPPRFNMAAFDFDPATPLALRIKLRYFPNL